jgi:hypothetical protein
MWYTLTSNHECLTPARICQDIVISHSPQNTQFCAHIMYRNVDCTKLLGRAQKMRIMKFCLLILFGCCSAAVNQKFLTLRAWDTEKYNLGEGLKNIFFHANNVQCQTDNDLSCLINGCHEHGKIFSLMARCKCVEKSCWHCFYLPSVHYWPFKFD